MTTCDRCHRELTDMMMRMRRNGKLLCIWCSHPRIYCKQCHARIELGAWRSTDKRCGPCALPEPEAVQP